MPARADGHLAIGSQATVAADDSVLLLTSPTWEAPAPNILAPGIEVTVTDGPVVGTDGALWYQVDAWGQVGFLPTWSLLASTDAPVADPELAAPAAEEEGGGSGGGQAIADFALGFAGYPYVWAGADPSTGFDCSGFTMYVVAQTLGIDITHDMFVQYGMGTPVAEGDLQPGDLVFFQNTFRPGMSHNGIYIGNNQMIHAENESTGVKISDITSDYYASRWYGAVRFG